MDSSSVSLPADPIAAELDQEISSLQAQIASLRSQRALQTATILSSHSTQSILSTLRSAASSTSPPSASILNDTTPLLAHATSLSTHNLTNLYRLCATITPFHINDPDPSAVDSGRVLALRIEVSSQGKFLRPYYIMLHKPFPASPALRIHRHTVPPCIPLANLTARYLPLKSIAAGALAKGGRKQDLVGFVKALRREVTAYHLRLSTVMALRKQFGLDEKVSRKGKGREQVIADIGVADAEAKQVRIEWVDGRIGRCMVGVRGEVVKCVVIGEGVRDRETERRIMGGDARMEGIGARLLEGIY